MTEFAGGGGGAPVPARQIPIVCPGHSRPIAEIAFSQPTDDGVFLISGCHAKTPMIRRADTGDWIGTFEGHKGAVWGVCLDDQALLAATASADFTARLWDAITGEQVHEFAHKHICKSVGFSSDRSKLATAGQEGIVRLFDVASPDSEAQMLRTSDTTSKKAIIRLRWGKDPSSIITGGADGILREWDLRTSEVVKTADLGGPIQDVEVHRNLDIISTAAGEHATFLDANTWGVLQKHKMPMGKSVTGSPQIYFKEEGGCTLHPSGTKFVAGGCDLWVRVFDFNTGEEKECHKGHHGPVRTMRYAPDGNTYATGSEDGTIRIWQT